MSEIIIVKCGIRTSIGNDVVFGRFDISLFARGCYFLCPHCHSKQCQSIVGPSEVICADDVISKFGEDVLSQSSIVGVGGDFIMQQQNWVDFCEDLKKKVPKLKIVWFTGEEPTKNRKPFFDCFDAIVWGRSVVDDKIQKHITMMGTQHSIVEKSYEIVIEKERY
jgi:pyruvate-formate lyase-activating enzyme